MPGQPFVQVDALIRRPVGSNPAAVFLLPSGRDEGGTQRGAREMIRVRPGRHAVTVLRGELD